MGFIEGTFFKKNLYVREGARKGKGEELRKDEVSAWSMARNTRYPPGLIPLPDDAPLLLQPLSTTFTGCWRWTRSWRWTVPLSWRAQSGHQCLQANKYLCYYTFHYHFSSIYVITLFYVTSIPCTGKCIISSQSVSALGHTSLQIPFTPSFLMVLK